MIKYYEELEKEQSIKIIDPITKKIEDEVLPNCYYINPNNILYNGMGKEGHKEASLKYTFDTIKDSFEGKKYKDFYGEYEISLLNILKKEINNYKRIITTRRITKIDAKIYLNMEIYDLEDPKILNLIIGIISSKIIVLNKFIELSKYQNKKETLNSILEQTNYDISDILVRYCNFNKIDSLSKKTIVTSSINFTSFLEYLKRNWKLIIVPSLKEDTIFHKSIVFESFIKKYPEYEDNIKIKRLILK